MRIEIGARGASLATGFALALATFAASSAQALAVPALRGHVNDYAHVLDPQHAQALEQKLMDYEQANEHQFALLTVPSLEGDSLEEFSIHVAESWKLGHKGKDDGLIMLIVPNERKMRIEVGYGLEGVIPDAVASRVIREVMTPAFRRSDFAGGIDAAFDALIHAAGDPNVARDARSRAERDRSQPFWALFGPLLFPLLLFILISAIFGGRRRRSGFFGPMMWGSGGWGSGGGGGWGGGGGGGGGWGGGGGGGFGGGGASGNW